MSKEIIVSKSKWLRNSGGVFKPMGNLADSSGNRCVLGFFCEQLLGSTEEQLVNAILPSRLGNNTLLRKNGLGLTLEDEISQINDKVETYAFISDEEQEKLLKDKFKKVGFKLTIIEE